MNDEEYKSTVGKFPTGVTIISTLYNNVLYGFTANSFTSVSLKPYLISFCLKKDSGSFHAFNKATYFAVNILANNQSELAAKFARHSSEKFKDTKYTIGKVSNAPLLDGVVSFIECKRYNQFDCGDHCIFIGEVRNMYYDNNKSPLLYFAKSFIELK